MPRQPERRTRIVSTLGPASDSPAVIEELIAAGIDVARLNMSHSDADSHRRLASRVRRAARKAGRPIGILADLQGPKLRLGRFDGILRLERGMDVTLCTKRSDMDLDRAILPVAYRPLSEETSAGDEILLADGEVRLLVTKVEAHRIRCRVLDGRTLTSRAGLSIPQAKIVRAAMTPKDRRDLALAVELDVDFIALSFVRRRQDLEQARRLIRKLGGKQLLIAKVETVPAVESLESILAASDAIMVARGDLGVELPPERVPIEQKRIIRSTGHAGKPVITATQMLESMRSSARPTRAEASDVANAVLDGSWGVMLSAETATGDYPVESVRMMDRIAREAEALAARRRVSRRRIESTSMAHSIAETAVWLAEDIGARALVALTRSGATARQVARAMPPLPTYGYTPSRQTLGRMTLFRSVVPRYLAEKRSLEIAIETVLGDLERRKEVARGDRIVILGGRPGPVEGTTDRIIVREV